MDRQDELLEKEDGRYYAIDKVGTGLGSIATTERLGRNNVSFGLPSGPALHLHLAHSAFLEVKDINPIDLFDAHDQGVWPDNQAPLFDFFEKLISHVVFSFTSIESFANESIPKDFKYSFKKKKTGEEITYGKNDIERWINLDEKLSEVLPSIFSVKTPKGTKVWEKYKKLKETRDRIIHLKSVDQKASGPDDKTIWGILLRAHSIPFCNHAHEIIGHFKPKKRWYKKYPY